MTFCKRRCACAVRTPKELLSAHPEPVVVDWPIQAPHMGLVSECQDAFALTLRFLKGGHGADLPKGRGLWVRVVVLLVSYQRMKVSRPEVR